MSKIFELKPDLSNLPQIVQQFDYIINTSSENLSFNNKSLLEANREQPTWYCYYYQQLQEIKTIQKLIENKTQQKRGELWRRYKENSSISLGSTDLQHYIDADSEYTSLTTYQLIVDEVAGNMYAVVKAFEQRGYTLRSLTELRIHEIEHSLAG